MKDLKDRLITENIFKKVSRWLNKTADKFSGQDTTRILNPVKDEIKKLPAECVFRIAIDMASLLAGNYFKSLPTKKDAEHMYYDCNYLQLTLGYDAVSDYQDEILKVMQGMYLGGTDGSFAYEFNMDPYPKKEFPTFAEYKK